MESFTCLPDLLFSWDVVNTIDSTTTAAFSQRHHRRHQRQHHHPPLPTPPQSPPIVASPPRLHDILAALERASAIATDGLRSLKDDGRKLEHIGGTLHQLQQNRTALVPHPLFSGQRALIRHPGSFAAKFFLLAITKHFADLISDPIRAAMDEENGIHQFPGEDAALVFTTPAFLRASSEDLFAPSETPNPYEETPIRPRRSKRSTGVKASRPLVPVKSHYATAADLRSQNEGTLFEGVSPFKHPELDLAEFLNLSPEKKAFAFSTPAPIMQWGGNDENESPVDETGTQVIDPRVLGLGDASNDDGEDNKDNEDEEEEIGPLVSGKTRSRPFSERLEDRSPKRRRSDRVSSADRMPLQDMCASAQNAVEVAGGRLPSTGSVKKVTPSRIPLFTRRTRAISDPPALPSHLAATARQFTYLEITIQNGSGSKPIRLVPETTVASTPRAKLEEVLSEKDKELLESPRFQALPQSATQLKKLVVHTQELLEAERRARMEAERTVEFMAQERQFLMLQLDNAKKRARSRTNSPRTNKAKQDVKSAAAAAAALAPTTTEPPSTLVRGITPVRPDEEFLPSAGYTTGDLTIERRQNPALAAALARHQEDVIANRLTPNEAGRRRRNVIREAELSGMTMDEMVDWTYQEERRKWEENFDKALSHRQPTDAELEVAAAFARDDAKGEIEERRRAMKKKREELNLPPPARPASRATSTRSQASTSTTTATTATQSSRPQSIYTRPGSSLSNRPGPSSQTRPGSSLQTRPPSSLQTRSGTSRPQSTIQPRTQPARPPSRTQPTRPQSRVQSTRPESRSEGPLRQKPVRGK